MTSLTYTVTREVADEEIDNMITGTGALAYPWWDEANRREDGMWRIRYREDGDTDSKILTKYVSDTVLAACVRELVQNEYLDPSHSDVQDALNEDLGLLDAAGADMVLQWAVFGDLVFS